MPGFQYFCVVLLLYLEKLFKYDGALLPLSLCALEMHGFVFLMSRNYHSELILLNFHVFSFSHQILMQTTSSGLSSVATVVDSVSIPAQVGLNFPNSVKVQKINKSKFILMTRFFFFFVPSRFWTWQFLFPIWLKKMSVLEYGPGCGWN